MDQNLFVALFLWWYPFGNYFVHQSTRVLTIPCIHFYGKKDRFTHLWFIQQARVDINQMSSKMGNLSLVTALIFLFFTSTSSGFMIISPWTYTFFRMMSTVSNLMVRSLWWGRLHHDAGEIPQPRSQAGRPVAGRPVTMSGEFIPHYQIYVISYNWCTVWSSKHLEVWKPVNVQFESVMNHDVDSEEWEWLGGQSWLSYRLYI